MEGRILSASPMELVGMLYDGGMRAITEARACLLAADVRGRSRAITRAHEILTELTVSLNPKEGGGIARNLSELYGYMQNVLLQAHLEQSDGKLEEVQGLLRTLSEGWTQARISRTGTGESVRAMAPNLLRDEVPAASPAYAAGYANGGNDGGYTSRNWSL